MRFCVCPFGLQLWLQPACPVGQVFDAGALAAGGRIIGKFMQLFAGEFVAFAAMIQLFALYTGFDGAAFCPIRLFDVGAAGAFHDLSVLAFAAFETATGFEHGMVHSFMNMGIKNWNKMTHKVYQRAYFRVNLQPAAGVWYNSVVRFLSGGVIPQSAGRWDGCEADLMEC